MDSLFEGGTGIISSACVCVALASRQNVNPDFHGLCDRLLQANPLPCILP